MTMQMVAPWCEFFQQFHDGFAIFGVEISGGLIGEKDERITDQCARDGYALLLTAGELRRVMLRAMCHADAFERALGFLFARRTHAAISEWKLDVFIDCKIADQIESLKDKSNFAIADAGAIGDFQVGTG